MRAAGGRNSFIATVSTQDVLRRIVEALTQAGIPYMFTGSFASSYHGNPRATQDFDIVIAPTPGQLHVLSEILPQSDYYFDLEDALELKAEWSNALRLAGAR